MRTRPKRGASPQTPNSPAPSLRRRNSVQKARLSSSDDENDELAANQRRLAFHCGCISCACSGFRRKTDPWAPDKSWILTIPKTTICSTCDHPLANHADLVANIPPADRTELLKIADDIEAIIERLKTQEPSSVLHVLFELVQSFQKTMRSREPQVLKMLPKTFGTPPFQQPTIIRLVAAYLSCLRLSEACIAVQVDIALMYLNTLNHYQVPPPESLSENTDPEYKLMFSRWLFFCSLPKTYKSLICHEPVSTFGRKFLLSTHAGFQKVLNVKEKHLKKARESVESFAVKFQRFLSKEYDLQENRLDPDAIFRFEQALIAGFHEAINVLPSQSSPAHEVTPELQNGFSDANGIEPDDEKPSTSYAALAPPPNKKRKQETKVVTPLCSPKRWERTKADFPADLVEKAIARNKAEEASRDIDRTFKPKDDPFYVAVKRLESIKKEIEEGVIWFRVISNTLDPRQNEEELGWLLDTVKLFTKQLPKMPVDYVTRIVFDHRQETMVLLKKDYGVVGGICFREFATQGFSEIVFCAVYGNQQIRGYGTHLMNHLKDYSIRTRKVYHLLTYADEFATGYFKKQGFTEKITLPFQQYNGYLKHYEGATLMECQLHPKIVYTDLPNFLLRSRDLYKCMAREQYPYLRLKYGGIEHLFKEKKDSAILPLSMIPGVNQLGDRGKGVKPSAFSNSSDLLSTLRTVLRKLKEDAHSWPFLEPVSAEEVPEYYDHISFPIDLQTIGERMERKYYIHEHLFIADLIRMFDNCYKFNGTDTEYYKAGYYLNRRFKQLWKHYFPTSALKVSLPAQEPLI
uniref:histone acetyltransferase n=1 Tax=Steinernema glaseri TaxID=37863 RepID=A0A1I7XZK4_9BILA